MSETQSDRPGFGPRKLALMSALALLGAAVGASFAHLTKELVLGWADELAAMVALVCLLSAGVAAVAVTLRPARVSSACAWLQVLTTALAGVMLLLPMFAPAGWPPALTYGVVLGLGAAQAVGNLQLWRISDELMRRVIVETGALSFWALQAALFAYAAAERLDLAQTVSGWGLTSILLAVYLVASTVVAVRRGLAQA